MSECLYFKKCNKNASIPSRGSKYAAGYDLSAAEPCIVPAHGKALIKTGLQFAPPHGTYGRIAPRSGLSWKNHTIVSAGVCDEDYRGEIGVVMFNLGGEDLIVKIGDRVAQLVLERISNPEVKVVDELPDTERGSGGFGSTG